MKTYDAVQKAVGSELGSVPLPPLFSYFVTGCSYIHRMIRAIRLGYHADKSSNETGKGNAVAYGAALHLIGDHSSLNFALSAALAAKCGADLLKEYREVSQRTKELSQALHGQYAVYQPVQWSNGEKNWSSRLWISLGLSAKNKITGAFAYLQRVKECTGKVLWGSLKLSVTTADTYLALSGDPIARLESYTDLIANWKEYDKQLRGDQHKLVRELEERNSLTDKILKYLDAPETCTAIVNNIKKQWGNAAAHSGNILNILKPVYTPGKITPMAIQFSKKTQPRLPPGRFPPWRGKKVTIQVPPENPEKSWVKETSETLSKNLANKVKELLLEKDDSQVNHPFL